MSLADWVFDDKRWPHLRAGFGTFVTGFGLYWFSHWPGVGAAAMCSGCLLFGMAVMR